MKLASQTSRLKRQNEIDNNINIPCKKGKRLDRYVDDVILPYITRFVRAMEPVGMVTPNLTIDLPEYNVLIFAHSGGASNLYTASRKKPAWVYCKNDTVSLGLTLGFEELRIMYKYRFIQDWKLLW